MSKNRIYKHILSLGACLVLVSACSLDGPSHITDHRVGVQEKVFVEEMDTDLLTEEFLRDVAYHYEENGEGAVDLMMGYDPTAKINTVLVVTDHLNKVVETFEQYGVKNVKPSIIPIKDLGDKSRTIISYTYFSVRAPEGCGYMPGYHDGRQVAFDEEYGLGCTIEHQYAKQVARPKDLAGTGWGHETSDGRRASNIVEGYRTGMPNKSLGGESSSGTASE